MIEALSAAGLLSLQTGAGEAPAANPIVSFLVPMGLILIIFYFLLIRPANKKQKAIQAMLSNLKNGDKVITSGGIHGVVAGMKDDIIHLKISDGVKIEISRNAIAALAGNPEE